MLANDLGILTDKEIEVAALIAQGLSRKIIAAKLNIATSTVKTRLYYIFRKTDCKNNAHLAAMYTYWIHLQGLQGVPYNNNSMNLRGWPTHANSS